MKIISGTILYKEGRALWPDSGLYPSTPFPSKIKQFYNEKEMWYIRNHAKTIRTQLRDDWDKAIAIEGLVGSGKSTFALKLASLIDYRFDISKDVIFGEFDTLIKKLYPKDPKDNLPKYKCLVIEESENLFYKREAMRGQQIDLKKLFDRFRFLNLCVILVLPNAMDLDTFLRDNRVHIVYRVFSKSKGRNAIRGFVKPFFRRINQGQYWSNKNYDTTNILRNYHWLGWNDYFYKIPPSWKRTHVIAKKKSYSKLGSKMLDSINGKPKTKGELYNRIGILCKEKGLKKSEVASILGIGKDTLSRV